MFLCSSAGKGFYHLQTPSHPVIFETYQISRYLRPVYLPGKKSLKLNMVCSSLKLLNISVFPVLEELFHGREKPRYFLKYFSSLDKFSKKSVTVNSDVQTALIANVYTPPTTGTTIYFPQNYIRF